MTAEQIEGRLKNLSSAEAGRLTHFNLTGTVTDAPFSLSGAAILFPEKSEEGRATLQLSNFPLSSVQKQLVSLPLNADSATLELGLNMTKEQLLLRSKAVMSIKDLIPSTANSDTALALALLQDTENTFSMTIDMEDSNRSLIEESMNSFQTTVIKATYAPFLLDPEFADLQDKTSLPFPAGSETISPDTQKTLRRYAELLKQHPHIALAITGMADRENDHTILLNRLKEKEQQRVEERNRELEAEYREKQKPFLPLSPDNSLQEEDIAKEELTGFVPISANPVQVNDEELLDLARERSLLVYDFCIHSLAIPSQRILVETDVKIIEKGPGNRVLLTLKPIPAALPSL